MEKKLTVFLSSDSNTWETRAQQVWSDEAPKVRFGVHNLSECPEDACIGRDLFDADDYLNAVRLGMLLASQGYTGIDVKEVPWED